MYQSLGIYFETLYEMNRNLIVFCGVTLDDNCYWDYCKYINNVVYAIPKLVPYVYDKKEGKLKIQDRDGLIEFSNELPDIKNDYQDLLNKHYEFLEKIKRIRNKFEHKMHKAYIPEIGYGNSCVFDLVYNCDDELIELHAKNFIEFAKGLNELFQKIQNSLEAQAFKENKQCYPYYRRLLRFKFLDFNSIYDSENLRVFAKAMIPF